MHLSSQEEYGLRCLVQVARNHADEPLRVHEIADAEGISPEYVAKLMRVLRNGELVTSTRGAAGGYRLGRDAEKITVWDVLHVLGGSVFSEGFCDAHPGSLRDCIHSSACSIRSLWRNLDSVLHALLSEVTVGALARGETGVDGTMAAASWRLPAPGEALRPLAAVPAAGARTSLPERTSPSGTTSPAETTLPPETTIVRKNRPPESHTQDHEVREKPVRENHIREEPVRDSRVPETAVRGTNEQ